MGGSASTAHNPVNQHQKDNEPLSQERINEIVKFILPLYYTKIPLHPGEKDRAEKSWKMIINNQCQHFNELKKKNPTMDKDQLSLDYFFEVFYGRMFDIHPSCRGLFHRSINKQGSFFGRMFSLLLDEIDDMDKFNKTLENMTRLHNKIGIKAFEYSIMGEVLFYALKTVLGPDVYTLQVHNAWVKFYSRVLDGIVPLVVEYELTHKDAAHSIMDKRLANQSTQHAAPIFADHKTTFHLPKTNMDSNSNNSTARDPESV